MSMSTHIVGFRPPDEKWKKMKAVWDSCTQADIQIPREVLEFFNDEEPSSAGVEIDLKHFTKKYTGPAEQGLEINIKELPKDLTIIRFYNSW